VSGFLSDVIRRNLARDPGDAPAVDLAQDLLEDDLSWVDATAWSPPEPPPRRSRDLIHPA
jgi:hypothetical protein